MKLVTVAEMRAIEREADANGLSYAQMMENAGQNLAREVATAYGYSPDKSVLGLVGAGNNGGDTLVALAHLALKGWRATAYTVRQRPNDPFIERLQRAGGRYVPGEEDPDFRKITALLDEHNVLLDGILGTGTHLPLRPDLLAILAHIQKILATIKEPPHIVAVDCPSGMDCDTGQAAPECLSAEMTVTMAAVKQGLLRFPAFKLAGEICLASIGAIVELPTWKGLKRVVAEARLARSLLPRRPLDAHKGTFGAALVVAGSLNYTGAALLSGEAAYRSGAGWVTLAVPAPLHSPLAGRFPEATWLLLPHDNGFIASAAAEIVLQNLARPTALLIGPGFGLEDTTAQFLDRLLDGQNGGGVRLPPAVIDADGLKLLARLENWPARLPSPAVLTPHPGEMAVLTGLSREEIQADRIGVAERYAQAWGHVVALKGACTVIAAPDGQTAIIPVATAALARAGTGDVLAGLIVGLRAQGVEAFPAALAGAWLHAQAGLRAADTLGNTASVLAGDVLAAVIEVISDLGINNS